MISTISCYQTTRLLAFKTLRYTFFCVNNTNGWMTHHWFYGRWSLLCILDPTPSSIRDMLSLFHVILVLSSFPYPLDQYKMYRFIIHLKKIIIVFAPLPPSVPPPFLFFQFIAKFLEKCCLYIMSAFSFPWPLKWLCAQGSVLASFSFMFTYRKETS